MRWIRHALLPSPPITLDGTETHADGNVTLKAAPAGDPAVTADDAVNYAWGESGINNGGDSSQPVYATLQAFGGIDKDIAVWVVKFSNACVTVMLPARDGSSPGPPECSKQEWDVAIDASTGEFVIAFSG